MFQRNLNISIYAKYGKSTAHAGLSLFIAMLVRVEFEITLTCTLWANTYSDMPTNQSFAAIRRIFSNAIYTLVNIFLYAMHQMEVAAATL